MRPSVLSMIEAHPSAFRDLAQRTFDMIMEGKLKVKGRGRYAAARGMKPGCSHSLLVHALK